MQEAMAVPNVPLHKLRWHCDPASLGFRTTDDLPPLEGIIGQERAQRALALGVEIARVGYNIYVCGMTGTGKLTAIQRLLAARKGNGALPPDLCYVFHFDNPERPRLLTLAAGQGKMLKKAMESLIADLKREIARVLSSENFQQRKKSHLQQAQRREQRLFQQFETRIAPQFGLLWHDADFAGAPVLAPIIDGKLVAFAELEERLETRHFPAEEYKRLREQYTACSSDFETVLASVHRLRHEAQEAVRALEHALVRPLIHQTVEGAAGSFSEPVVQEYFREVENALNEDIERFQDMALLADKEPMPSTSLSPGYEDDAFQEYQVNVIVDNADTTGVPVIFETSPTYKNLFGAIEPTLEYGGIWRCDFTGIRAGAIHRANGGYLVFNALDALSEPIVWSTLKRILRYGHAEIQAYDQHTLVPSTTLKPAPIPCDVKVIMIGDEGLYAELTREDDAFKRLFKVKADFDTTIPRRDDTIAQYAGFVRRLCQEEQLRPFDGSGVAAVVEFGVRLAGRQNKLSARLDVIADVLREADYWASKSGQTIVTRALVEQALQERIARVNMIEEKLQEAIAEGLLLITTHGAIVGQVNGLSVYEIEEDYLFGCPIRITAETSMGDTGVVNIEREVNLSDATHNKGVLILSGYLRHAYAQDKPLVLSASLCIEQSYEGIIGDSASAAEVYALLSSLAGLPVNQGLAVTGSVNQKGELQPISAINEKIEGFFDVCRLQGVTGTQGVILPQQNVDDLMLRQDVIDAIAAGRFHLYAITHLNEGLGLLMGVQAGQYQPGEGYPAASVNGRVDARLRGYTEQWYALQHGAASGDDSAIWTHAAPKP